MSQDEAPVQTKILERDIERLERKQDEANSRFDRHLEIYAQNGKELVRLREVMAESHKGFDSKLKAIHETTKDNRDYIFSVEERTKEALTALGIRMTTIEVEMGKTVTKMGVIAAIAAPVLAAVVTLVVERFV